METLKKYPDSCPLDAMGCDDCMYFTYLTITNAKVLGKCIQYNKIICYLGDTAFVVIKDYEK